MNRSIIAVLAATAMCSGCGSFPLGTAFPERNQSKDETRLAVLECQDRAKTEANSDARVAGSFIAGLTIVGAPIAIAEERRKTREVWQDCMLAKGYRVVPPPGMTLDAKSAAPTPPAQAKSAAELSPTSLPSAAAQTSSPPPTTVPSSSPPPASAPTTVAPQRDIAAQLEKLNSLRAKGLITEAEYTAKRKELLDSL
jgi:Short C-terminal domain